MIYFISDVHLGFETRALDKKREDLLLNTLDIISKDCKTLVILGDLFDFWFEYKTVIPKIFYRTITKFYELKQKGIEIIYLMGNHDFGHKNFFSEELGVEIIKNDVETVFNGKKFYLSHGDGKSFYDSIYNFLKKILRNPISLYLYTKLHPDLGIKLASGSSKESRKHTSKKKYGEIEGMEQFAEQKISEGFDYVVMGHRHKLILKQIGNGFYVNLGDWFNEPHIGSFDGDKFKLIKVRELISEKINF
ncbi:MAG: UDP-2,3-diacylglucosamine diphosphatase [Candidatus Kapabacteria bacterium]|nr:UDP-2,3-diacylglucosamine diphosphatase [Candidatus Kapabacteria bacterium]